MVTERDFSNLAPFELNTVLVNLCHQLPKISINNFPDAPSDVFDRRDVSEHKERLLAIFDQLLTFSPTTEAFKRHIRYVFDCVYSYGLDESLPKLQIRFLDHNGPGIFSLPRCKEIDRREFRFVFNVKQNWDEGGLFDSSKTTRVPGTFSLNDEVVEWSAQFIELYGEEP